MTNDKDTASLKERAKRANTWAGTEEGKNATAQAISLAHETSKELTTKRRVFPRDMQTPLF